MSPVALNILMLNPGTHIGSTCFKSSYFSEFYHHRTLRSLRYALNKLNRYNIQNQCFID